MARRALPTASVVAALVAPMTEDRCPACGMPIPMISDFQRHLHAVERDAEHVAALYTLLGIDYAALKADERAEALERARERAHQRGWRLL